MENNNKLKVIISSIFLLVILTSAAFAYFGSFNIDVNNKIAVNILTEDPGTASFVSDATFLNLQVPALNMNPINSNDEVEAAKNEAVLNVTLKGHNNVLTVCTFDIVFEYDLSSNIYGDGTTYKTSGADKEITMQVISNSGTNYYQNETNFDYNTSNGWTQKTSTTGAKKVLVSGAQITSTGTENTQSYKFIGKYYNLSLSQSQLEGKSFTGKIYADNLSCDTKEDKTLYSLVQKKYNEGNTFVKLYDGDGSDTYANPVYYYNGAVQDNNVLFAGFCWKMVRTTDTGGVKLIYNGTPQTIIESTPIEQSQYSNLSNDATYPYTFDSTDKTWASTVQAMGKTGTITFTVSEPGDYALSYIVSGYAGTEEDKAKFYKDDTLLGTYSGNVEESILLEGLTTSNIIKVEYTKAREPSPNPEEEKVRFSIGKTKGKSSKICNNTGEASQIGTSAFNSSYKSPAYVGYMYNTVYTYSSKSMSSESNIVFGNSFTYSGGTYTLTDTKTVSKWEGRYNTINNNHYTCLTTGTTCTSLYYVYYTNISNAHYITLTNGKSVSAALNEMLYADDVNKTNSTMKTYIETWYENNMTAYTSYLEDTTFCNDRRILSLGGWNPNGGITHTLSSSFDLQFNNHNTNYSLVCAIETDQFRVENTKAPLKYPVGLLTAPEVLLAYKDASYGTYYLNTGGNFWLGSPLSFSNVYAYGRSVDGTGSLGSYYVDRSSGARPSVSLKPGTGYVSGDGSYTDPFVIE